MYLMFKIKIFKMQLLKNVTADFFAFTSIFQQNTLSLCRNCLLRGAFLKKGTMLIGRSIITLMDIALCCQLEGLNL